MVTLKHRFYGFVELRESGVKTGTHCSCGHLTGTIQKVHKIAESIIWGKIKLEFTVGTSVTLISMSALPFHLRVNSLQYAIILKVFSCFYCQLNCQICNICL
jgi:hypothetical protein